jgi:hypothetical protein
MCTAMLLVSGTKVIRQTSAASSDFTTGVSSVSASRQIRANSRGCRPSARRPTKPSRANRSSRRSPTSRDRGNAVAFSTNRSARVSISAWLASKHHQIRDSKNVHVHRKCQPATAVLASTGVCPATLPCSGNRHHPMNATKPELDIDRSHQWACDRRQASTLVV